MTTPANGGTAQAASTGTQQAAQEAPAATGTDSTQQTGGEPQAGQQQEQGGTGAAFDPSTIQDPTLRAQVEAQIKDAAEARREAARYRTERNTLQQEREAAQRASETAEQTAEREQQERQAELDRLRDENRELRSGSLIAQALTDAKPINPATVEGIVRARLQYGQDGTPTNLSDVVQGLKQSDPYLFRRTDAGAGAGQGGGSGDTPPPAGINDFIRSGGRGALAR